jgi:C-terminal processing protease CtpA/Prc
MPHPLPTQRRRFQQLELVTNFGCDFFQLALRAAEVITAIDHRAVEGLTRAQVVEKLRDAPGSQVKQIVRVGPNEPIELLITRELLPFR